MIILARHLREVNTGPQRRCYNGCHAKSELLWTGWEILEYCSMEQADARLKFWRSINDYAISQRGEGARSDYTAIPEEE